MKIIYFPLLLMTVFSFTHLNAQEEMEMDSLSYSIGIMMAQNLSRQGFDTVEAESLAAGIADVMAENELKINPAQAQQIVQDYLAEKRSKQFEAVIKEGKDYLEKNGAREGVITTESGLQYEILTEGTGDKPQKSDKVTVHYEGKLIDGTVFDSSIKRGEPTSFGVGGVIAGWTEALQLMPVGSKWRLHIPYNLAYGERGAGQKIGPYSTLIFDVELIKINE